MVRKTVLPLLSLVVLAGCSLGEILLTTGAIGGNIFLAEIVAQALGFTTPI